MRYILSVIGIIILTILAVIFVVGRGSNKPNPSTVNKTAAKINLVDYIDKNSSVINTIEGEINGIENHRIIRITVSPSLRKLEIIRGYNGEVIGSTTLLNTKEAYDAFLRAINGSGFTKTRVLAASIDEKGVCPLGRHYGYELYDSTEQIFRSWGDSCSRNDGSMSGSGEIVRTLFQVQIPGYNELTASVSL